MKLSILTLTLFMAVTTTISASENKYQCIADRLQAINSDIYYNLSESDIYSMLTIPEMFGHYDAQNALKLCTKLK